MLPIKLRSLPLVLAFLVCAPGIAARRVDKSPMAPAPAPPQIAAAQKVFISNGGGIDIDNAGGLTVIKGGPDRPFNEFYAAMTSWGRYDLVSTPSDADLVLEISFALSDTGLQQWQMQGAFSANVTVLGPLRLTILDPKTHVVLWTIVEYVPAAILLGNRDKNFDESMNTLVGRLKKLAERPAATSRP
jgi:hypothetical protein